MKRLAEFITDNIDPIMKEWEDFAFSVPTGAPKLSHKALLDHLPQILGFIVRDIQTAQSPSQQVTKSRGKNVKNASLPDTAAEIHGALRLENGFDLKQMVSEFRVLRATVTKLWIQDSKVLNEDQLLDLIRFNEAIDQALAESVARFSYNLDASKDLFLGILGHDIRSPLGAISMCASLLSRPGQLTERQSKLATQIEESSARIMEIVTHLLELTRARLGAKIPLEKQEMDFGAAVTKIVAEVQKEHPDREITLKVEGDVNGLGDIARFQQAFSNLMSNAIQYGQKDIPITVRVQGNKQIRLSVHNMGRPISAGTIATIFNSLVRGDDAMEQSKENANLGLGLYIVKSIVLAHEGELSVTSTEENGTTFIADFPR